MVDFFATIQKQFDNQMPFVAYKKTNASQINALLQNNDTVYKTTHFDDCGFVFSPFSNIENNVLTPLKHSRLLHCDFNIEQIDNQTNNINITENSTEKTFHINLINKGIEAIKKNAFKKVVLSRHEIIHDIHENPILILKKLLAIYNTALVYCWYHPKIGLWLGATPETLLNITGNSLTTMSLAGTQPYKKKGEVVWKNKEKNEQQLVTNFIVENLKNKAESLNISETKTVKAGELLHLQTKIRVRLLQNNNLKQIIKSLHPTPAVCGLPRTDAKKFIINNENYDREFYTGFLGELNFKQQQTRNRNSRNIENNAYNSTQTTTDLYVNLRCMQIKNGCATIYAGGGITKDSIPENEWEETVSKAMTMKTIL